MAIVQKKILKIYSNNIQNRKFGDKTHLIADLSKSTGSEIKQYGQDVFIAKPSIEISEVIRSNLFKKIQRIEL